MFTLLIKILLHLENIVHPFQYKYRCPICLKNVEKFEKIADSYLKKLDKYQADIQLFNVETLNLLQYTCPHCKESDRSRLYALYLSKVFKKLDKSKEYKFVDFAPSPELSNYIQSFPFLNYRSADLYMSGVDDKVDITNMGIYEDESIDMFLCSHILEHIQDDRKALSELYRILNKKGFGILMVPIRTNINKDYEDKKIKSIPDRWKYYGQGDHVRNYSKKGFMNKVRNSGFKLKELKMNYFSEKEFIKYGIHSRSVLYIVTK